MSRWLKRQFVPHELNGFRPLFLRRESALSLAGALAVLEILFFVLPTLYFPQFVHDFNLTSVLPGVLSSLTNERRVANNLSVLSVNATLTQAAQLKAGDMASKGYFAHNTPDGKTPWYWFEKAGYKYRYAGENLAVNFSDSAEVTQAWMDSPTHRANIVGRNYTEMGTGIATGVYKGRETLFVVQLYGRPSSKLVSAVVEAPTENLFSIKTLLSSPKQTTNTVLYLALALVIAALFINIVIKFESQFPDLIANGAVVALLIIGFHLGNNYVSSRSLQTSFIEYSPVETTVSMR